MGPGLGAGDDVPCAPLPLLVGPSTLLMSEFLKLAEKGNEQTEIRR